MTQWEILEGVRDLLRTGTPPTSYNMTIDQWNAYKCERAASKIDILITRHQNAIKGTRAEREKQKKARMRDRYRSTVCIGCHNNRYNYQSNGDIRNAPTTGDGCWHLDSIKRGICKLRRDPY
jgi:hypothetical protein